MLASEGYRRHHGFLPPQSTVRPASYKPWLKNPRSYDTDYDFSPYIVAVAAPFVVTAMYRGVQRWALGTPVLVAAALGPHGPTIRRAFIHVDPQAYSDYVLDNF